MSSSKISIVLAATALLVSVLFATPLGQAASRLVLPKNSVGTAQLRKDAVTGLKVRNGTLMGADFKAGQLPRGTQGPKGDVGPQGPPGDAGAQGLQGAPGTSTAVVRTATRVIAPGAEFYATASCAPGERAVGGGGVFIEGMPGGVLKASAPVNVAGNDYSKEGEPAGKWYVYAFNGAATAQTLEAFAICAAG